MGAYLRVGAYPGNYGIKDVIKLILFVECTNQFVKVEYDPAASTITCVFESRNSNHSCNISYGSCQQEMNQAAQGSATMEFPNQVVIKIESSGSDCYMYVVKATNGTFTVIVKGNFNIESRGKFECLPNFIPYSQKTWWELRLADWPQLLLI